MGVRKGWGEGGQVGGSGRAGGMEGAERAGGGRRAGQRPQECVSDSNINFRLLPKQTARTSV